MVFTTKITKVSND